MRKVNLALYQPDIPQNVGAAMRLCACLGTRLHIIEPCGFPWNDKKVRRSAMDYLNIIEYVRHMDWDNFLQSIKRRDISGNAGQKQSRLILMTTKTTRPYTSFSFCDGDIILAGKESAGVPDDVHKVVDAEITIPMQAQARSINVVNASAMVLGEAIRQEEMRQETNV